MNSDEWRYIRGLNPPLSSFTLLIALPAAACVPNLCQQALRDCHLLPTTALYCLSPQNSACSYHHQTCATKYLRASWLNTVTLLSDLGVGMPGPTFDPCLPTVLRSSILPGQVSSHLALQNNEEAFNSPRIVSPDSSGTTVAMPATGEIPAATVTPMPVSTPTPEAYSAYGATPQSPAIFELELCSELKAFSEPGNLSAAVVTIPDLLK
jgi:hypothetical protein